MKIKITDKFVFSKYCMKKKFPFLKDHGHKLPINLKRIKNLKIKLTQTENWDKWLNFNVCLNQLIEWTLNKTSADSWFFLSWTVCSRRYFNLLSRVYTLTSANRSSDNVGTISIMVECEKCCPMLASCKSLDCSKKAFDSIWKLQIKHLQKK